MLYIDQRGLLHKLHPFTKLTFLFLTATLCYLSGLSNLHLLLLLALDILIFISGRILIASMKMMVHILLPLMLFMLPIHGLFYPANTTEFFSIGGIVFYQEGFSFAFRTMLQLSVVLGASIIFIFTTHPAVLITAVSNAGASTSLGYLLGFPLLLVETMRERAVTIQNAQRARGLEIDGNVFRRFFSLKPLLFPLLIGAIVSIEQRSIALEVRGFKSKGAKTSLRIVEDSLSQKTARWLMLVTAIVIPLVHILV